MSNEEDQQALAEYQAECQYVSSQYQELIDIQESLDKAKRHFEKECREIMVELY